MSACPRPDKDAFTSRSIAMQVVRRTPRYRRMGLTAYRCRPGCGQWHVGRRLRRPVVAWRSEP
jgi:hypothetical protein